MHMRTKHSQQTNNGSSSELLKPARSTLGVQISAKMISKVIGPKYVAIAKSWIPTMAVWGTAGGVALVHLTDWRVILDYVPYISGKFKKDE